MNWIKEQKFLVGLGAGTLVGVIVLWFVGSAAKSRHANAKDEFDRTAAEASRFEKLKLYPSQVNLDSKKLKLAEYREQAAKLQAAFEPYRPEALTNIKLEEFSDALKQANEQTRKAFDAAGTELPEEYFCGFAAYRSNQPPGDATGILAFQLGAVKQMLLDLAAAGPSRLINVHRPELPEEQGRKFEAQAEQVARALPLEITFHGSEAAAREFLSSLVNSKQNYIVVRTLQVVNERQDPPRASDARFERQRGSAEAPRPAVDGTVDFNQLFAPEGGAEGGGPQPAPQPVAEAPVDTSRILHQVLGNEELTVFLRVDVLQFLAPKELP